MKNKNRPQWLVRMVFNSPARVSVFAFALLILLGTVLLMLPVSSRMNHMGFIDALFTATSASCVTGLVVVDTGTFFTHFGQGVILALIQVGGLGIMTLSTLLILMTGKRPGLVGHAVIHDTFTHGGEKNMSSVLKDVVMFAFIMEGFGSICLFLRFLPEKGFLSALYYGIFHSVSAFCNAGFALFSDSFVQYKGDWAVNMTLSILIVGGGIGFVVFSELKRQYPLGRRSWSGISLHSKMVISTTLILIVLGTLLILPMEWNNTLAGMSDPSRFLSAMFQSVSARTAGFNSLPIGHFANETICIVIFLMFIGASPGSCGGGIKTTTLATLVMLGISRFRGQEHPRIFKRTIPESCTGKAIGLVMVSILVVAVATMALLICELGGQAHPQTRGKFLEILFEVVSAFGTVGLSTGITPTLSGLGKFIITIIMFIGRLGPLVVVIAISRGKVSRVHYAEENIMIG